MSDPTFEEIPPAEVIEEPPAEVIEEPPPVAAAPEVAGIDVNQKIDQIGAAFTDLSVRVARIEKFLGFTTPP